MRFARPDHDMSQREHYLFVCTNRRDETDPRGSCTLRGSAEVRQALKDQLAATGLASLEARVCASSCLDQCLSGVTILVEPDHFFYGRVTLADVPEIVDGLVQNKRVERLVLTDRRSEERLRVSHGVCALAFITSRNRGRPEAITRQVSQH